MKKYLAVSVILFISLFNYSYAIEVGDVIINEIMWDQSEYIELKNTTPGSIDISGWVVKAGGNAEIIIDAGKTIEADSFYLITDNGATSNTADEIDAMTLLNGGELITLENASGTVIDTANQNGSWFAGKNTSVGEAMERNSDLAIGTTNLSWHTSTGNIGGRIGTPRNANTLVPGEGITDIVINEIMYDPADTEPDYEWFELYNFGTSDADLSNWTVSDNEGTYSIPVGTILIAGDFLVFARTTSAANGTGDLIYGTEAANLKFSNTSDDIHLRNSIGEIIDSVSFAFTWGASNQTGPENNTLSRKSSGLPSNDITSWGTSSDQDGTPGAANVMDQTLPTVVHSEINKSYDARGIVIHLTATDTGSGIGNVTINYRKSGDTEYTEALCTNNNDKYTGIIPANIVTTLGVEYYIKVSDGNNNISNYPTNNPADSPVVVTVIAGGPLLVINEIMYDPPSSEPAYEWFEIYNKGNDTINLNGWSISDLEETKVLPDTVIIAPSAYYVFGQSSSAANGNVDFVYNKYLLRFSNSFGDQIILKDSQGIVVDEVNYDPASGGANGSGPNNLSLERQSQNYALSNSEENYLTSTKNGGTPGESNSPNFLLSVFSVPEIFNPVNGETVQIFFTLAEAATVTIKIVDIDDTTNIIRTIVNNQFYNAGSQNTIWDGKNDLSAITLGAFSYVVSANNGLNIVTDNLNEKSFNFLNETVGYGTINQDYKLPFGEFTFNAENNRYVDFSYKLTRPANIRLNIKTLPDEDTHVIIFDGITAGQNTVRWYGRLDDLTFFDYPTQLSTFIIAEQVIEVLPGNVVIAENPMKIEINNVSHNAILKGETLTVDYKISDDATVSIDVLKQDTMGAFQVIRSLISSQELLRGSHSFIWDGKSDGDSFVSYNKSLFDKKDLYYVRLIAERPGEGDSTTEYITTRIMDLKISMYDANDTDIVFFGFSTNNTDTLTFSFDSNVTSVIPFDNYWTSDTIFLNLFQKPGYHEIFIKLRDTKKTFSFKINHITIVDHSDTTFDPTIGETFTFTASMPLADTTTFFIVGFTDTEATFIKSLDTGTFRDSGMYVISWDGKNDSGMLSSSKEDSFVLYGGARESIRSVSKFVRNNHIFVGSSIFYKQEKSSTLSLNLNIKN